AAGDVVGEVAVGDGLDLVEARLVLELRVRVRRRDALEAEVEDRPPAGEVQGQPDAVRARLPDALDGGPQDRRVVAAAQAAVGGEHQQHGMLDRLAVLQKRVLEFPRVGAEVGGQLGDLARVRLGLAGAVHRLAEARRRDQLHRPRDLADVLHRSAALHKGAGLGHETALASSWDGWDGWDSSVASVPSVPWLTP